MPTTMQPPTFQSLCRAYPTLRMFVAEAEDFQSSAGPNFCANAAWCGHIGRGPSLRNRVVTVADKAARRFGQRAYDVVYSGVYDLLPDCGNCGCFRREDF